MTRLDWLAIGFVVIWTAFVCRDQLHAIGTKLYKHKRKKDK